MRENCQRKRQARVLQCGSTQWSKIRKVFQRGDHPKFGHFPLETYVLSLKYQKLEKSVERNSGFWIIFGFEEVGHSFEVKSKENI